MFSQSQHALLIAVHINATSVFEIDYEVDRDGSRKVKRNEPESGGI